MDARSVSGVQRYFADVVGLWIAQGHVVDFVVARGAWPIFREQFPQSRLISGDDFFKFSPTQLRRTWLYLPAFAWRMLTPFFLRLPDRYDVVFACAQLIYEVAPALWLARRQRAAMAVKVHHVVSAQRRPKGVFDRIHLVAERVSVRWLNRRADLILCSTPLVARDFNALETQLGLAPSSLRCTGYGVDLERLPFSIHEEKKFDGVLLGRVHEHKGAFDAPAVWQAVRRSLPNARLLIIGEGPHREELSRRFESAGLGPNTGAVTFSGGVSDLEKNALLKTCRVGISLSREEGWGLSVTEFLAVGLPVVAMELPVFLEVFPGQIDLVKQGDTLGVADRVVHWLRHGDEANRQAATGRAFIARYDRHQVAREELAALTAAVKKI